MKGCGSGVHSYLFVVRQVGKFLSLIDLATGDVRHLKVASGADIPNALDSFDTRYVLRHGAQFHQTECSSLPLAKRRVLYQRLAEQCAQAPPTSCTGTCGSSNTFLVLFDAILERRESRQRRQNRKNGGELLVGYIGDQHERLLAAQPDILRSLAADIDCTEKGSNVSGFLLRFSDIPLAGPNRFRRYQLDYTSAFVEQELREKT